MDILIISAISVGIVIVPICIGFLLKKFNIDIKLLFTGIDITKSIISFVKVMAIDMGVDKDKVDDFSEVILDTLEYMKNISDDVRKDVKIAEGVRYAKELAYSFGLELNDNKNTIINTIVTASYNLYDVLKK